MEHPSTPAEIMVEFTSEVHDNDIAVLRELIDAGWSSPVAREAHNLEVVGSNPAPATFCKSCRNLELSYLPTVGSAARKLKRSA